MARYWEFYRIGNLQEEKSASVVEEIEVTLYISAHVAIFIMRYEYESSVLNVLLLVQLVIRVIYSNNVVM